MSTEIATVQTQAAPPAKLTGMSIATTREAQSVQAQMIVAKQFPRDEIDANRRIVTACKRKALAEVSQYEYTKGGQPVTGPSIRLAEAMAQAWGNIDFGFIELENSPGVSSKVLAFAHDLETNTRRSMTFDIPHVRVTKRGTTILTDPRDIYETVANQAARRIRACVLAVIPGDVQDMAIEECNKTLAGNNAEPLKDRILKMLKAADQIGVSRDMLERKLGHNVDAISETEMVRIRNWFTAIRDGHSSREDIFEVEAAKPAESGEKSKSRTDAAKKATAKKEESPKDAKEKPAALSFNDLQARCFDVTSIEEADEIDALIANSLCSPTEKEDLTQILQAWRDQPKA